jgi:DNA-binding beta-propeller fold protein YncE
MGVAVDQAGNVYVADTGHSRMVKLAPTGELLADWGDTLLRHPDGVAIATDGTVFVADTGNDRIVRFGPNGETLAALGGPGTAPGEFRDPHSLAVDTDGNVFVADTLNDRIQKLDASGQAILQVGEVGGGPKEDAYETSRGRGVGQFRFPKGVALDGQGQVYVADTDNFRIVKIDGSSGEFLAQWIGLGSVLKNRQVPGSFLSPRGVAVDPTSGGIFVADTFNH